MLDESYRVKRNLKARVYKKIRQLKKLHQKLEKGYIFSESEKWKFKLLQKSINSLRGEVIVNNLENGGSYSQLINQLQLSASKITSLRNLIKK